MVPFLDLKKINQSYQPELGRAVARVVESGWYVRGEELRRFEEAYASFTGVRHCVGVGNGFDALRLIFRGWQTQGLLQADDEVIVPANTYIASILAVSECGLRPVLVEPDIRTYTLDAHCVEEKITPRTKVIMVVHLYGRNAMTADIREIAHRHSLKIVEDNAQAAGCRWNGRRTGSLGDAAAHSFFPTKNLGCLGDGGAVTTDDENLASAVRTLGNYGSHEKNTNDIRGVNSRLDEVQAAVLSVKLNRLEADNERRRTVARYYLQHIRNSGIILPEAGTAPDEHVWHLFVVRCAERDALRQHLKEREIESLVHYPIPPHRQKAYGGMKGLSLPVTDEIHRQVLSLPANPLMTDAEIERVVDAVNGFPSKR